MEKGNIKDVIITNANQVRGVSLKDFKSYEDIDAFPEEDHKHLYSVVWKFGLRAKQMESRLQSQNDRMKKIIRKIHEAIDDSLYKELTEYLGENP